MTGTGLRHDSIWMGWHACCTCHFKYMDSQCIEMSLLECRHPIFSHNPSLSIDLLQALYQPQDDSYASAAFDIMRSHDPEAIDVAGTRLLAKQGKS